MRVKKDYGTCILCGKSLKKGQSSYCSIKCQHEYAYIKYIERWKAGEETGRSGSLGVSRYIRRYLFEKYNSKCVRCGWSEVNVYSGNIPLEIEHVNGDSGDNSEGNLILLCPNCHSLTSTYRALNKGRGREERIKYSLRYTSAEEIFKENGKKVYTRRAKRGELKTHPCVVCGTPTSNKYCCSKACEYERRIKENDLSSSIPSKGQLVDDLKSMSMVKIGEKYSVSDNAVRKWCKRYGLPYKYQDIKDYFAKN